MTAENVLAGLSEDKQNLITTSGISERTLIIIGSGPVGVKLAEAVSQTRGNIRIYIFNDEESKPYNKSLITKYLAKDRIDDHFFNEIIEKNNRVFLINEKIINVDKEKKVVYSDAEEFYRYDDLVFSTGSRAIKPEITYDEDVYTLKNISELNKFYENRHKYTRVAVIGGGILGNEVALSLSESISNVSLYYSGSYNLSGSIDETSSGFMNEFLLGNGIHPMNRKKLVRVEYQNAKYNLVFSDSVYEEGFDAVFICIGTIANSELADRAGLDTNDGIVVDARARTAYPGIYAVGDCARYDGIRSGTIAAGFRQVEIMVNNLIGAGVPENHKQRIDETTIRKDKTVEIINSQAASSDSGCSETIFFKSGSRVRSIQLVNSYITRIFSIGDATWCSAVNRNFIGDKITGLDRFLFLFLGITRKTFKSVNIKTESEPEDIFCKCMDITHRKVNDFFIKNGFDRKKLYKETGLGSGCGSCKNSLLHIYKSENKSDNFLFSWIPVILALSSMTLILMAFLKSESEIYKWFSSIYSQYSFRFSDHISGYFLLIILFFEMLILFSKKKSLLKVMNNNKFHIFMASIFVFLVSYHTGIQHYYNNSSFIIISTILVFYLGLIMFFINKWKKLKRNYMIDLLYNKIKRAHRIVCYSMLSLLTIHVFSVYYY